MRKDVCKSQPIGSTNALHGELFAAGTELGTRLKVFTIAYMQNTNMRTTNITQCGDIGSINVVSRVNFSLKTSSSACPCSVVRPQSTQRPRELPGVATP
jgi:hypothetical protein